MPMELLRVTDVMLIAAVQQEFQKEFPFLKLEFFQPAKNPAGVTLKYRIPETRSLKFYALQNPQDPIIITPSMTVADLVKKFQNQYDLSLQILRQSGKAWLETTLTESWTLKEQNEQGKALSTIRV